MKNLKRNYIRRKKTYNKSMSLVHQTLELINLVKNTKITNTELDQLSKQHADRIEAACWDPRMKLTDDAYQQIVIQKTKELCNILINKFAPQVNTISLMIKIHGKNNLQQLASKNLKIEIQNNCLPMPIFYSKSDNLNTSNNFLFENEKANALFPQFNINNEDFVPSIINTESSNDSLDVGFTDNFIQPDFV